MTTLVATSSAGEHREFPLSPPLSVLPGDVLTTNGRTLYLIRGGTVVATRETSGDGTLFVPPPITEARTLTSILFFRGPKVPGKIATITNIVLAVNGTLRVNFASGTEREFAGGVAEALSATEYLDTEDTTAEDMAILSAVRSSPDGTNLGVRIGSSCAVDFYANQPVVLTVD